MPAVFVFDDLYMRLRISPKRIVFLVETLAEIAETRPLNIFLGDPQVELDGKQLAVTHAPVPGFQKYAQSLNIVETWPWPWLCQPNNAPVTHSHLGLRKRINHEDKSSAKELFVMWPFIYLEKNLSLKTGKMSNTVQRLVAEKLSKIDQQIENTILKLLESQPHPTPLTTGQIADLLDFGNDKTFSKV